jgi:hypothetical protein
MTHAKQIILFGVICIDYLLLTVAMLCLYLNKTLKIRGHLFLRQNCIGYEMLFLFFNALREGRTMFNKFQTQDHHCT